MGTRAGSEIVVRQALPADVRAIYELVRPYAEHRILVAKELVEYFESVQEFVVGEDVSDRGAGEVVGCGALHVLWDDIAEVRTLAVAPEMSGRGIGHQLLEALLERARRLGLRRVFCLTFEVDFFRRHGFDVIDGTPVGTDVYGEMLRSHDDGVAEFLDLARVKPNTLGNARMLLEL
ncbi:amino-acid N-acetyltransferase [Georgenia halophila]